ncbi:MAG: hypothetical protein K2P61_02225 [Burkholderiaceae bacterium]|nr:hypothetical protein [Burkholderiaceae bacterium]
MRVYRLAVIRYFLLCLTCITPLIVHAQTPELSPDGARSILLTGFAVNKQAQLKDIDNIAQGLPREIGHRLEKQLWKVKTTPDLLSTEWRLSPASPQLLGQIAGLYDVRYVVAGEVRDAGISTQAMLWGLREKHSRVIDIEIRVYDARAGSLLGRFDFSGKANGDVLIGAEHVFAGDAFRATPYGKAIDEVIEQAAQALSATLLSQAQ